MIDSIGENPYFDFASYFDYEEFKNLEPEIVAGIARCKSKYAIESGWKIYNPSKTTQKIGHKMLLESYEEFKKDKTVPVDSLAHSWSDKLDGNLIAKNKMTRYLKSKYGAYDQYWALQIVENLDYSDTPTDIVTWEKELMKYFPKTLDFIHNRLLTTIFQKITAANILYIDNDGIPFEHHDASVDDNGNIISPPNTLEYQFIHFRNPRRGFYLLDTETKSKIHLNTWVGLWDTRNYHCSSRSVYSDWSLRVDGTFTEEMQRAIK